MDWYFTGRFKKIKVFWLSNIQIDSAIYKRDNYKKTMGEYLKYLIIIYTRGS